MAEQGQVNHKCKVGGISGDTPTKELDKAQDEECPTLLEKAACVQKGMQEWNAHQATWELYRPAVEDAMEAANLDDYRLLRSTFGPTYSGADLSGKALNGISRMSIAYNDKGRWANQQAYTTKLDPRLEKLEASAHFRANEAELKPVLAGLRAARDKMVKTLNGPAMGKHGCMGEVARIIDRFSGEGGKDSGQELVNGKGTAKERAANAESIIEATRPGAISIEVVYDLQFKEQCILLSQIAPLADYSFALDNVDLNADDTETPRIGEEDAKVEIRRRLPYKTNASKNAPLVVDGESFGFINKLTQYPGMADFYNMTTAQVSSLQPMIRLYRVQGANSTGATTSETEIFFDSNLKDSKTILEDKRKRGFGVGIQSFNVVFDGQDMFAQKRCIKANLTLFANDFDELLIKRGGFRYIDLALKTGENIKAETKKYKVNDDLNFRLKAVFGWQKPPGNGPASSLTGLQNTYVSVNLTPVTHTFDFDEYGRVKFNIEYLAYVEEFFSKPKLNIFTDAETFSKILKRKMAFESANRNLNCEESKGLREQIKNIKSADQQAIKKEKTDMHSYLLKQMFVQGRIHFLNFSREDLESVIKLGPYHNITAGKLHRGNQSMKLKLSDDLGEAFKSEISKSDADKNVKKEMMASFMVAGQDNINIAFFYVGDLLDIILGTMDDFLANTKKFIKSAGDYEGLTISDAVKEAEVIALQRTIEEYKKFRLVMGPLEIVDHSNETAKYVNFSDVPISVKYFSEWLTSKLLKKEQALYPLTQFLKDFFNDLLRNYLNDDSCFPFSIKQKVRLFESVITSYPAGGTTDEITQRIINRGNKYNRYFALGSISQPVLNLKGSSQYGRPNPGIDKEMNYFVFFAGRTQPMNLLNGDRSADTGRGIHHYMIGENKGLLKKISLNKTDSPGLKEVRFEQEGYDGLHQLREIYDVEVDSYANVTAMPGNYIFVDPQGFAPQMAAFNKKKFDLTDLGVGGYYMVTKASHQFGPGIANTKLNAVWVASAGSAAQNAMVEAARGGNEIRAAKCLAEQNKDAKVGTVQAAGSFEFTGDASDFSSLDENPEAPPTAAAAAAKRERINDAIGDAYGGM